MKKYLLGFDIGSSAVKVSIINSETGELISSASSPKTEMKINSPQDGWAEQNPDDWWHHLKIACKKALSKVNSKKYMISAIGISYQMHGLVMVDKEGKLIYPSIIWCDSRAVEIGDIAFTKLGREYCLGSCLNSPGNFTASKLKWVKDFRPDIYERIYKIMLPGDYIAYRLTGEINTTISGLSEGILWDFKENKIADKILEHYSIEKGFLPNLIPTFSTQGFLTKESAEQLGLKPKIPVTYRAGDQPNNAFSLNVINPGEIATTAGTSGVVYGIVDDNTSDPLSRVNNFAHVNYTISNPIKGVLLCINGTGILYSWMRSLLTEYNISYNRLNKEASEISIGSEGLLILPFGNGSERALNNKNIGCQICDINFNKHNRKHIFRAVQEGIAFSFSYGIDIMKKIGLQVNVMKAGNTNMFQSELFAQSVANTVNASVEIYNTDGAQGAARGAGIGSNIYTSFDHAFVGLKNIKIINPENNLNEEYSSAYDRWKEKLDLFYKDDILS